MNWDATMANLKVEPNALPDADPMDKLPEPARAKLQALRDAKEAIHAQYRLVSEHLDHARTAYRRAQHNFEEFKQAYDAGQVERRAEGPPDYMSGERTTRVVHVERDHKRLAAEQAQLDKLELEFERRTDQRDDLGRQQQAVGGLIVACEQWIAQQRGRLEMTDFKPPKLKKGVSLHEAVEDVRVELPHMEGQRTMTVNAPRTREEVIGDLTRIVEDLAVSGQPDVSLLADPGGDIRWATSRATVHAATTGGEQAMGSAVVADAVGLVAWLAKDEILARLTAHIDEFHDPDVALSAEDRASDLHQIDRDILRLNRIEEAHIAEAESLGMTIQRREDALPAAVLQVCDPAHDEGET